MSNRYAEPTTSNLDAVASVVAGYVGSDGQGRGLCPLTGKGPDKFAFSIGDEGLVVLACHCGKCSVRMADTDWSREAAEALVARGVPRGTLHALAHQSGPQNRSSADAVGPAPNLPSADALDRAQHRLLGNRKQLDLLMKRVGLSVEQAINAGLGWDPEEERVWLPVEDEAGNLLTLIRRDFRPVMPAKRVKSMIWTGSKGAFLYAPLGVRQDEAVIVAAGERDCLALLALGMNAVCFTNGEKVVPGPERMTPLLGQDLVFAYDNDEGGRQVQKVASALLPHASSVRIVNWSNDIPDGYDVWDILSDDQLGVEAVQKALTDASPWGEGDEKAQQDQAEFDKALARAIVTERVRDHMAVLRADALFSAPVSDHTLAEMLTKEREPLRFTIEALHPEGSNGLIAAQYKVGKTTLMMNLLKSYADGDKFLGNFRMNPGDGRIALFNYELTEDMVIDAYLKPLGIENPDRVVVLNLRGKNFDLRSPSAFAWGVQWLQDRGCDALIVDPFGAAARLANENDNSEARNWLLGTLDPFKEAAGIRDLWMPAHTGRAEKAEGSEHVRGASSVDDWADVRWLFTKSAVTDSDGNTFNRRFMSAAGRGVDVSERQIGFDKDDGTLFVEEFVSRAKARTEGASIQALRVAAAMAHLNDGKGPNTGALHEAMKGETGAIKSGVKESIDKGWLTVSKGPNNSKFLGVTDAGRAVLGGA